MSKVFLNPTDFQGQIDKFEAGADKIKDIKYVLDSKGVKLQSIDRYLECITEFNNTVELFHQMLVLDVESMKLIKAKWMNLDSDIATKTLKDILFGQGEK